MLASRSGSMGKGECVEKFLYGGWRGMRGGKKEKLLKEKNDIFLTLEL